MKNVKTLKYCKEKIFDDGEYTGCGICPNSKVCPEIKKCAWCGCVSGVAYERRGDVFACAACFHEKGI